MSKPVLQGKEFEHVLVQYNYAFPEYHGDCFRLGWTKLMGAPA